MAWKRYTWLNIGARDVHISVYKSQEGLIVCINAFHNFGEQIGDCTVTVHVRKRSISTLFFIEWSFEIPMQMYLRSSESLWHPFKDICLTFFYSQKKYLKGGHEWEGHIQSVHRILVFQPEDTIIKIANLKQMWTFIYWVIWFLTGCRRSYFRTS